MDTSNNSFIIQQESSKKKSFVTKTFEWNLLVGNYFSELLSLPVRQLLPQAFD
jgi:hypothetical protein